PENERPRRDEQGRLVEDGQKARPQRWKYDSNGNLEEYQDPDGATYRYRYQSWNAKHEEIDPLGHTTVFGQSVQGLVNRVADPGGTVTDYVYDLNDRVTEIFRDGARREAYKYDGAGNIVEKTDAHGHTLVTWTIGRASLDASRRLSSGETHKFKYDTRGRIVEAITPSGTATFVFSADGKRLEDKRDGSGVAHEFDAGQLIATVVFDRFRTSYAVDDDGAIAIGDPTGAIHRIVVGTGGLVARRLSNGTSELSSYDGAGRCRGKAVDRAPWLSPPWIRSFSYSPAGDLRTIADSDFGTVQYVYDAAHRIAEEVLPS